MLSTDLKTQHLILESKIHVDKEAWGWLLQRYEVKDFGAVASGVVTVPLGYYVEIRLF